MLPQLDAKLGFFALILLAVALEVSADVLFKKWAIENKSLLFATGMVLYIIGTVFWALSLKQELLSKAVTVFTILNFIAVVLAGVFVFGEELNLANKAGICLGIISIMLMGF